ncbi:MAG TPA: FKBP-type peptidyl-prolyl cis-trans isomerase [Bacteroidales bacterium]|nr:FKBP-type peptidyl-prolyl cis-trans isomerase [Bacteroidales bacterium]HPB26160.1 FKBP-type peptidyl-prolyl cis-trans isomerase [Bacteroidales bacterium]HPI30977.1 FKBP-type peptidyl-prolyl cis-trans isomerase [Bacteroidales bacterium]HQN15638.1 FKBP-type peptidyl-prolyl cis-trans isomerase [Bacteroidales bacterium]HQP16487.1 FKBP-type peptidyl-prolyl cis-trans isomerase [Bacteroidales bacterium]
MKKNCPANRRVLFVFFGLAWLAVMNFSCGNTEKTKVVINEDTIKTSLVKVNKELTAREDRDIENYIQRHEWAMQKTGTGLRYQIYKKGAGAQPKDQDKVVISFVVSLINGVECYNSKNDGMKLFELGKAQVESGLEEGIKLMHAGDKAKLIIPSHLAFGFMGDDNKIPKRATLIYDVELVEIK